MSDAEWLAALADEGHIAAPPAVSEEPSLFPHLMPVWEAFLVLNRCRLIGFGGVSGLLFSEISAYLNSHHIEGEWRDDMERLLLALDDEYLAHTNKPKSHAD